MEKASSARMKLTDAIAAQAILPEGRSDFTIWDTEARGFGLRLRATTKTWILFYRPAGAGRSVAAKRFKIGTTTTIKTASDARKIAFAVLGDIARGKDPAAERAEIKRREKAKVKDLLDRYEKSLVKRAYVGRKGVMGLLRTRLAAYLDRDIRELRGPVLAAISQRIEDQGLDGAAKAFRTRCGTFLNWCLLTAKVIDEVPIFGQKQARSTRADKIKAEEKGRALSDDEIVALWFAASPSTVFGRLVRYLLLTGGRRKEGALLERSWKVGSQIVYPANVMKSGTEFKLPVTPQVNDLLKACRIDARSDLYFPSDRTGRTISGWTKFVEELRLASGVNFSLHDLRRTVRTKMSTLGVPVDIAELCIAHTRRGLEKIYNKDEAEAAKLDAFKAWHRKIDQLIAPENAKRRTAALRRSIPSATLTAEDMELEERARREGRDAYHDWLDGLSEDEIEATGRQPQPERGAVE